MGIISCAFTCLFVLLYASATVVLNLFMYAIASVYGVFTHQEPAQLGQGIQLWGLYHLQHRHNVSQMLIHRNKNVVILTKISSLWQLPVQAAIDDNFIKMETFSFQCRGTNEQSGSWPLHIWVIFFQKTLFLFPMWFIRNVIFLDWSNVIDIWSAL